MAKKPKDSKKARPDCPFCGNDSKLRKNNPRSYDLEHDKYKCPGCGTIFYNVNGILVSEESYDEINDTSWMHPNESYEEFMEHEDFD